VVFAEDRVIECCHFGCFYASTLVDTQVDDQGIGTHLAYHLFGDHVPCPALLSAKGTDDDIGRLQRVDQRIGVDGRSIYLLSEQVFDAPQFVQVVVENLDPRAQADGGPGCILGHRSRTDDDDLSGRYAGYPTEDNTFALVNCRQVFRGEGDDTAARDLTHGANDRHTANLVFDEFVGKRRDLLFKERLQAIGCKLSELNGGD